MKRRPEQLALDAVASALPDASDEEHLRALLCIAVTAAARRRGLEPRGGRLFADARIIDAPAVESLLSGSGDDLESIARAYELLIAGPARKRSGSYFTPAALADTVVLRALAPDLDAERAHALRVCDPALGAGAFLLAVGRRLSAVASRREIVQQCLYGVDRAPLAVAVAEALLWLWVGDADFTLEQAGAHLRCGDSLISGAAAVLEGFTPFDWEAAFPGVFAERGGFDLVVGNPPWVAFAGRAAQPLDPALRAFFARTYAAMRGYPTLHALFVERAAGLAPRGTVALLVPSPLADLDGYRAARRALTARHVVREPLLELGQDAFDSVVQPCFALIADASDSAQSDERPWRLSERQRAAGEAAEVRPPELLALLAGAPPMPRELFREMGFQTSRVVTQTLLLRAPEPDERHAYPLLEGRDVGEFRQGAPRLFLAEDRDVLRASRCRLRAREDYERVRFVVRQTARYPIAALHGGLPFRNTLLAGLDVDGLSPPLVVALLNSALYRALHLASRRDARQQAFPQVKIAHLRALPAPPRDIEQRARLCDLAMRATRGGVDAALRAALDAAVFDLFAVPPPHRAAVIAFLAARAPELGYVGSAPDRHPGPLDQVRRRLGL